MQSAILKSATQAKPQVHNRISEIIYGLLNDPSFSPARFDGDGEITE